MGSFTGNVARELLRQAPCDLFLFVEPKEEPRAFENVYVAMPDSSEFSRRVYHRALDLAEHAGAQMLTLVHVQTTFAEAKEKASGSPATEDALKMLIKERGAARSNLIIIWFEAIPASPPLKLFYSAAPICW